MTPDETTPDLHAVARPAPARRWTSAVWRGLRSKCPSCGSAALFGRYLRVNEVCPACGEELHHHRADDAPPYMTIFAVGHLVVPAMLVVEKVWQPALWIHFALWLPLTVLLCLMFLPRIKGAVVGLQWALRMHGFEHSATCAAAAEAADGAPALQDPAQ